MKRKEYLIEFNKVRNGANDYLFNFQDAFLETMGISEFGGVNVSAEVLVLKTENMYHVSAKLSGKATVACDICSDDFVYPVSGVHSFIIKLSETERYDDDEIIYITPVTLDFDLSQFLFDSFMLSIPLKRTCSMGGKACNAAALEKLSLMQQEVDKTTKDQSDPRWDKLKGIMGKK